MKPTYSYRYHTFWPRFWAGIVDALVFLPLAILDEHIIYPILGAGVLAGIWFAFDSFVFIAYSILLHGFTGQTVGKYATGVKVLDISEQPLTLKQAFLRDSIPFAIICIGVLLDLPKAMSGVHPHYQRVPDAPGLLLAYVGLAWFAVEVITMLWNNKRRAVHDFIAGSVVMRVGAYVSIPGVLITGLNPKSSARDAGIAEGDVIIEYDGERNLTSEKLRAFTRTVNPKGNPVNVVLLRASGEYSVRAPRGALGISIRDTRV